MNVLLMEPFTELRVMLRGVLKAIGVDSLHEPKTSLEGVNILMSETIDLMITAQATHPYSGILLIKMVRFAKEEKIRHLRTILCADGYDESLSKKAINEGVDLILKKPFSADDVRTMVMKVINNRAAFLETPAYTGPCRRQFESAYKHQDRRDELFNPGQGTYTRSLQNIAYRIIDTREKTAKSKLSEREAALQQRGIIIESSTFEEEKLSIDKLKAGMTITKPVKAGGGMLVMPQHTVLSEKTINRLIDLLKTGRIEDGIWVEKDAIIEETGPNSKA